jgi:Mn-dependent DtxR family transcriptional regulator
MDADLERTFLVQASTELAGGGRVSVADLATATGIDLDDAKAAVEQLAAQDLVEVEDGAVVRVTASGLAEIESAG